MLHQRLDDGFLLLLKFEIHSLLHKVSFDQLGDGVCQQLGVGKWRVDKDKVEGL